MERIRSIWRRITPCHNRTPDEDESDEDEHTPTASPENTSLVEIESLETEDVETEDVETENVETENLETEDVNTRVESIATTTQVIEYDIQAQEEEAMPLPDVVPEEPKGRQGDIKRQLYARFYVHPGRSSFWPCPTMARCDITHLGEIPFSGRLDTETLNSMMQVLFYVRPYRMLRELEPKARTTMIFELHLAGFEPSMDPSSCSVCNVPFEAGEKICWFHCAHAYHEKCVIWLIRNFDKCPVCKASIKIC